MRAKARQPGTAFTSIASKRPSRAGNKSTPATNVSVAFAAMGFGLNLAQLRLLSRDLGVNEAPDAVYGTYAHLKRERLKISSAVAEAKSGGAS